MTVDIPAGVSTNNYLTLRGQGAAGPRNGPSGDLLVMLDIKEDDRFERQGDDLIFDLPLSFSQAALGGEHEVPTPYGDERLRIPARHSAGDGAPAAGERDSRFWGRTVRAISWCGYTSGRRSGYPDEQERLFRELAKLEGEAPKRAPGFWSKLKEALGA